MVQTAKLDLEFALAVVNEMSKVRQNPHSYIAMMERYKSKFQGNKYLIAPRTYMVTEEGKPAVDEAIAYLRRCRPVGKLSLSKGMSQGALDHVIDQGRTGETGHDGSDGSRSDTRINRYGKWLVTAGENIAYGPASPADIVMQLIIDDGVPGRGHRKNIFEKSFKVAGVAIGPHSKFRKVCVITYAGGYSEKRR